MKERIALKSLHAPFFLNDPINYGSSFSRGIKFRVCDTQFLFMSGTASVDKNGKTHCPNNFKKQLERVYKNLTALLKSENADWHDVIMTRCYLKDMKYYKLFNKLRTRYYRKLKLHPFPASIAIQATLCRPDLLVEIEVTAAYKFKK
ncbi:MAG: RidA family protein [Elusimicrobia bacterium]|nr:RidA family protein [Candidatus Liberimonas magnetica]